MKEIEFEGEKYQFVNVTKTSEKVSKDGVLPNKCTNNTKLVIQNNPDLDIKYIQGFLMMFSSSDYKWKAVPHVWCKLDNEFFDPTIELKDTDLYSLMKGGVSYLLYNEVETEFIPEMVKKTVPFTENFIPIINYMEGNYPYK